MVILLLFYESFLFLGRNTYGKYILLKFAVVISSVTYKHRILPFLKRFCHYNPFRFSLIIPKLPTLHIHVKSSYKTDNFWQKLNS